MAFKLCDKGFLHELFVKQFFSDFPETSHLADGLHVTLLIGSQAPRQLIHLIIVIFDVLICTALDELVMLIQLHVLRLSVNLEVCGESFIFCLWQFTRQVIPLVLNLVGHSSLVSESVESSMHIVNSLDVLFLNGLLCMESFLVQLSHLRIFIENGSQFKLILGSTSFFGFLASFLLNFFALF